MNKPTWSEVISSMTSDDINRIAEEQGKSYDEVERVLLNIKKEADRGKAYRDKQRAAMKAVKALIVK